MFKPKFVSVAIVEGAEVVVIELEPLVEVDEDVVPEAEVLVDEAEDVLVKLELLEDIDEEVALEDELLVDEIEEVELETELLLNEDVLGPDAVLVDGPDPVEVVEDLIVVEPLFVELGPTLEECFELETLPDVLLLLYEPVLVLVPVAFVVLVGLTEEPQLPQEACIDDHARVIMQI